MMPTKFYLDSYRIKAMGNEKDIDDIITPLSFRRVFFVGGFGRLMYFGDMNSKNGFSWVVFIIILAHMIQIPLINSRR